VKLLPRRNPEPVAGEPADDSAPASAGKGRPTPKRRESTVQRGPVTPPKTRKEAVARQREQTKAAKAARAAGRSGTAGAPTTAQQRRQALRSGDPALLPRRDQGRTRKLARDYVDSHRMLSNFLLVLFPIMIVSYLIPGLQFIVLAALVILIVEWNLAGRRIRKLAIERFGAAEGGAFSIGFYAGSRAYLPRRWRMPAPQVSHGDEI
jgi:hypothetical protein